MKKFVILGILLVGGGAIAGAIKQWADGDVLTASDLNGALQHIHNNMVGNHGARLVNADVSTTAAIAHSKLAAPALVPKAYAQVGETNVNPNCTGTCTLINAYNVAAVTAVDAGVYNVQLTAGGTDNEYAVIVSPGYAFTETVTVCTASENIDATNFRVFCIKSTDAAAQNSPFNFVLFDSENY